MLTETDERIQPNFRYCFRTPTLKGVTVPAVYAATENRVSVFTNYKCVGKHPTYDENTALCAELETEKGKLLVYGTIIGISGNRHSSYSRDLQKQLSDISRFVKAGYDICMAGDFNCTFCDSYYFTKSGRALITSSLAENNISILTKDTPQCIDHIAISKSFIGDSETSVEQWNIDKSLSDHKGIVAEICF